ncbi:hypothetical protein E4T49_03704 [Aureobasidium sp. EXF-10728]|nr:hypothetical protein E4T49_03704 [Aureobasidium sp. EXF-10728]
MRSSIALLAASALGALAQETSTMSIFMGGQPLNGQKYAGSVVSVGPSDTVYEFLCTAPACGTLAVSQTITVGPSHLNYQFVTETMGLGASASETCKISGTASAICTVIVDLEVDVPDVTSTTTSVAITTTLTGSQLAGVPVELTGGLEKLSAATPASGSGSSASSGSGGSASSSASGSSATIASGASSIMANSRGGDVLALVMFSAVSVSVGALLIL